MADDLKNLPPKKRYTKQAKPAAAAIKTTARVEDNTAAPVMSKAETFEANKKNLVKQSNWFLVANSNKRITGDSPEGERWMNAVQYAMDNPGEWIRFMKEGDAWDAKSVVSCDVEISHEIGGKYNQLHSHMIIKIQHRSSIQVDRHKLKVCLMEQTGFNGLYVDSKLFYDPTITLQAYIRKQADQAKEAREALAKGKQNNDLHPQPMRIKNEINKLI
jgi:hypothetical protein